MRRARERRDKRRVGERQREREKGREGWSEALCLRTLVKLVDQDRTVRWIKPL